MTKPVQTGFGMVAAVLVAGLLAQSPSSRQDHAKRSIAPSPAAFAKAIELGLTVPETGHEVEVAIAKARSEMLTVEAGLAGTIKVAASARQIQQVQDDPAETIKTDLAIKVTEDRMAGRILRSRSGETITLPGHTMSVVAAIPANENALAFPAKSASLQSSAQGDLKATLLSIADEAHERHGRPRLTAQAMSEYLSLYALRGRAEAIGNLLLSGHSEQAGGFWSADLSSTTDAALAQEGLGLNQKSFGALAGYDAVARDLVIDGDRLVYGGFASAFSAAADHDASWFATPDDVSGGSLGLYAIFESGDLSVTGLLRADLSETNRHLAANQLDFSSAIETYKAEIVARYRHDMTDWYLQPEVSLTYLRGERNVTLPLGTTQFDAAESFRAQVAVKAGGIVYNRGDLAVEPSVTIKLSQEMLGASDVTFLNGAPSGGSVDPVSGRTVGSVSVNVDVIDTGAGVTGFVKADGQVSDDDKASAGVSVGARAKW